MDFSEEIPSNDNSGDVEIDKELRARRSSILKIPKRKSSEETQDFATKASRRVSFASSNFIKPFAADPEKNTIWDLTYEEEINHTDSTKSSGGKSEILTMSSFGISEDAMEIETIAKTKPRIPFMPIDVQEYDINKENIFISESSNTEEIYDMELTEVVSKRIIEKNVSKSRSTLNTTNIYIDSTSDLEYRGIRSNELVGTGVLEHIEDINITEVSSTNSKILVSENKSSSIKSILKKKTVNESVYFKTEDEDGNMEFTCSLLCPEQLRTRQKSIKNSEMSDLLSKNSDNELVLHKENVNISTLQYGSTVNDFSNRTIINFQNNEDSMDITSLPNKPIFENKNVRQNVHSKATSNLSKIKNVFKRKSNVELQENEYPSVITVKEKHFKNINLTCSDRLNQDAERTLYYSGDDSMIFTSAFPSRNVQNIDQVNEQLKQRTLHFHQDGSTMEFTCALSSHQEIKKNKDFENKKIVWS